MLNILYLPIYLIIVWATLGGWYAFGLLMILMFIDGIMESNDSSLFKREPKEPKFKPEDYRTDWNTLIEKEQEDGSWIKEGQDIPKDAFIATPIEKIDENGRKIIINRWISREDAIECIDNLK